MNGSEALFLLCRLTLGAAFLLAGCSKLLNWSAFAETVATIAPAQGSIRRWGFLVPITELALAVLLLLGLAPHLAAAMSAAILVTFSVILVARPAVANRCHCFGGSTRRLEGFGLPRNIGLIALTGGLFVLGPDPLAESFGRAIDRASIHDVWLLGLAGIGLAFVVAILLQLAGLNLGEVGTGEVEG